MITFDGGSYEKCRITIPKTDIIDKVNVLKYKNWSLNLTNEKSYVGSDRFFYFNYDGKLEIFYM